VAVAAVCEKIDLIFPFISKSTISITGLAAFLLLPLAQYNPIFPLFGLETSLHIDVRSFGEVISGDLGQLPDEDNVVPLCSFLLSTVLCIRLGSPKAKGTNGSLWNFCSGSLPFSQTGGHVRHLHLNSVYPHI
jgi:hypothetical protein